MSLLIPPEIAAINDVIKAARHSNWVLLRAADVDGMTKSDELRSAALAHEGLAETLSDIVRAQDQAPPAKNPPEEGEVFEAVWTDLRAGLSGDPISSALSQCKKAEDQLIDAANAALEVPDLPQAAKIAITTVTSSRLPAIDRS